MLLNEVTKNRLFFQVLQEAIIYYSGSEGRGVAVVVPLVIVKITYYLVNDLPFLTSIHSHMIIIVFSTEYSSKETLVVLKLVR